MASNLATNQRPQYFDTDGNPLSGGRLTFYEVGSVIPKQVYADPDMTILLPNPLLLDIGGFVPDSSVFYGVGNYKVLVEKLVNPGQPIPVYAEEYTVPIVVGADSALSGLNDLTVINNVVDIPTLPLTGPQTAYALGYYSPHDGGGGVFKWEPNSTAPDDLGSVLNSQHSATGRWIRIFNSNQCMTAQWGVIQGQGTDMVGRLTNASTYAIANDLDIVITQGAIQCQGNFNFNGGHVIIAEGFRLVRLNALTPTTMSIICDSVDVKVTSPFIDIDGPNTYIDFFVNKQFNIYPEWYNLPNQYDDSFEAIGRAVLSSTNSHNSPIIFTGTYRVIASHIPVSPILNIPNAYFYKGSVLINELIEYSIVLNKVEHEVDAEYFLRTINDDEYNRYDTQSCKAQAHWFLPHSPTSNQLTSLAFSLTQNGTVNGTLYWSNIGVYAMPEVADEANMAKTLHIISEQTKWQTSGNTFQTLNKVFTPSMFDNDDVQGAAHFASRNNAWVDGKYQDYIIPATINCGGAVGFKNMNLYSTVNSYYYFTLLSGTISLENVTTNANRPVNFDANFVSFNFTNCKFYGDGILTFNIVGITGNIQDCIFSTFYALNIYPSGSSSQFIISNNTFRDTVTQQIIQGIEDGGDGNIIVSNNTFRNMTGVGVGSIDHFGLILQVPNNMRFTNNYCEVLPGATNLIIVNNTVVYGTPSKAIITNFICTNNTFTIEGLNASTIRPHNLLIALSCADFGHRAIVKDNTSNVIGVNPVLYGTEYARQIGAAGGGTGSASHDVAITLMLPLYENSLTRWTWTVNNGSESAPAQRCNVVIPPSGPDYVDVLPFVQAQYVNLGQGDGLYTVLCQFFCITPQTGRTIFTVPDCGYSFYRDAL
jgi:hypothetical protein